MTRSLVLGAGIVGRAAAWDLNRRGHEVTIADFSPEAAHRVGEELGIAWETVDVRLPHTVARVLGGIDCIVAAVPYRFGVELASVATKHQCHYFDFGGNPAIVKKQLQLDRAAQESDVAIVPDCGLAPGYANVIATGLIANAPGAPIDVRIQVGVLPQAPVGALKYQLTFNVGGLINEYAEPCEIIDDGFAATVDPLGRAESVHWPGLGDLEAFSTAGGTSTMCQTYAGRVRSLEYKTLRYPGHRSVFAALRELGFFSTMPVTGRELAPRDLLIDLLTTNLPASGPDVTLIAVTISAPGYHREVRVEDHSDTLFSSLARTTAFPATALVDMIATGTNAFRGAAAMHTVADQVSLDSELAGLGITATEKNQPNGFGPDH
jgi:lysine 6-dehydrogenase